MFIVLLIILAAIFFWLGWFVHALMDVAARADADERELFSHLSGPDTAEDPPMYRWRDGCWTLGDRLKHESSA
jgi:hypothetical protein